MPKKDVPEQQNIRVESRGQRGGVTAGIINIHGLVPARIEMRQLEYARAQSGYVSRIEVVVVARYAVPKLQVLIYSPTLRDMRIEPTGQVIFARTGPADATINYGKGAGMPARYVHIENASGTYLIEAITMRKEKIEVEVATMGGA